MLAFTGKRFDSYNAKCPNCSTKNTFLTSYSLKLLSETTLGEKHFLYIGGVNLLFVCGVMINDRGRFGVPFGNIIVHT